MQKDRGYLEIEHTADWEVAVWAPDLPALFEQAAYGMFALQQIKLYATPRLTRQVTIEGQDAESLLVRFLNELLYQNEHYGLGFDSYQVMIDDNEKRLQAKANGAQIAHQAKEIKAVTYHNLVIQKTERGIETQIVFDV